MGGHFWKVSTFSNQFIIVKVADIAKKNVEQIVTVACAS